MHDNSDELYAVMTFTLPSPQAHTVPKCPSCGRLMFRRCRWCDFQAARLAANRAYNRRRLFRRLWATLCILGWLVAVALCASWAAALVSANAGCTHEPRYFSGPIRVLHTYPTN